MPVGVSRPHGLSQAGCVRSQIVWLRLKNGRPEQAKRNVLNAHLLSFVPKFQHNTNHSLRERRHVTLVAVVHHSGLDLLPGLTYRPSHELLLFPLSWLTFILIPVSGPSISITGLVGPAGSIAWMSGSASRKVLRNALGLAQERVPISSGRLRPARIGSASGHAEPL